MLVTAKHWVLNREFDGQMFDDTIVLRDVELPPLAPGEMLVRVILLSIDPTHRPWLSQLWDPTQHSPTRIGDPIRGVILGRVTASNAGKFAVGELVSGFHSWSGQFVTDGTDLEAFESYGLPLEDAWGLLAIVGPTAHIGLLDIGRPQPGETVVVTAAGGGVGMIAGQIAKMQGCRVVGIAGGPEKCARLIDEFGFDAAVDHYAPDLVDALARACPNGIDVHFENVGGKVLNAGLSLINDHGRIVICGLIAIYNQNVDAVDPKLFHKVLLRKLTLGGFTALESPPRVAEARRDCARWMGEGKLKIRIHMVDGLENAAQAEALFYSGATKGKMMVRVSADD